MLPLFRAVKKYLILYAQDGNKRVFAINRRITSSLSSKYVMVLIAEVKSLYNRSWIALPFPLEILSSRGDLAFTEANYTEDNDMVA